MRAPDAPLEQLRKICLALPEAHEVKAWGRADLPRAEQAVCDVCRYRQSPRQRTVGGLVQAVARHPGHARAHCNSQTIFVPPYVGGQGWVGIYLDRQTDWKSVADRLCDGYRLVAPKRLLALLPD